MPISLRADFDAAGLRRAARESRDAKQVRRFKRLLRCEKTADSCGALVACAWALILVKSVHTA